MEANEGKLIVLAKVQDIITLRRDANAPLKALTTSLPPRSEKGNMEDVLTVPEVEASAGTWCPASHLSILHVCKTTRLEHLPIRVLRSDSLESHIRSRQNSGCGESDLSNYDVANNTDNRFPNRVE